MIFIYEGKSNYKIPILRDINLYEKFKVIENFSTVYEAIRKNYHGANNPMFGKKHSEETKKRIAEKMLKNKNNRFCNNKIFDKLIDKNDGYVPQTKKQKLNYLKAKKIMEAELEKQRQELLLQQQIEKIKMNDISIKEELDIEIGYSPDKISLEDLL